MNYLFVYFFVVFFDVLTLLRFTTLNLFADIALNRSDCIVDVRSPLLIFFVKRFDKLIEFALSCISYLFYVFQDVLILVLDALFHLLLCLAHGLIHIFDSFGSFFFHFYHRNITFFDAFFGTFHQLTHKFFHLNYLLVHTIFNFLVSFFLCYSD